MFFTTWRQWLKRLTRPNHGKTHRNKPAVRLRVELLEDRVVPAAPLQPDNFTNLGVFAPAPGTYTVDTTGLTLTGPGTSLTGVSSGGVAVFDFSSVTIGNGVVINASGSAAWALLSQGDLTIAGTINNDGASATDFSTVADPGGPGGGAGGSATSAGQGPGSGGAATGPHGGGGGGAFGGSGARGATDGTDIGGTAGTAYGNLLTQLQGGSGGAGGSTFVPGGGGGGAIELGALGTFQISAGGSVLADGGNGALDDFGASGGGSGGGILIDAPIVNLLGTLSAQGGQGGSGGAFGDGGGGGGGRVVVLYSAITDTGTQNVNGGTSGTAGGSHGVLSPDASGAIGQFTTTQYTSGALTYTVPADSTPHIVTVRLHGQTLEILDGANLVASQPAASTTTVTITGAASEANSVIIDYTFGGQFIVPVTFNGDATGTNSLTINGGTFNTDTYTYTSAHNGTVQLGTAGPLIGYTNLTPLTNSGTATNIKFKLPDGTVGASLEDNGTTPTDGMSRLRSTNATFEQTDFANPSGSVEIDSGTGPDSVTVAAGFSSGTGVGQFDAGLTIDLANATDTVAVNPALTATSVAITAAGGIALNNNITTTGGTQAYTGPTTIGATPTTLTGSTVTFNRTLDDGNAAGTDALTVTGNAVFDGAVGTTTAALQSLFVSGTTGINGGSVMTTGTQEYQGAVTVGTADLELTASVATFDTTVNGGGFNLDIDANAVLGGAVTNLLSMDVSGTTAANGGVVTSTAAQEYHGAVTAGADLEVNASQVIFDSTVNGGGFNLDIDADAVLDAAATNLLTLDVSGNTAAFGETVTSTGTQEYHGAVTIGATPTTLTGSTVTFDSTVDDGNAAGTDALTVTGNAVFGGAVGTTTAALKSLTTGAAGTTTIKGGAVKTTGDQTYNNAVTITADTVLTDSGSGITFGSTVDGDGNGPWNLTTTTTSATAQIQFNNTVGGTHPLKSLTVNDAGAGDTATGAIVGAGTTFTKQGSGTITLSNTNTYTGATTVSAGALLVTGSTSATSSVAVNGGTLGGTGTVGGAVTVNTGGTINPGTAGTVGTLTVGSLSFNGGTYQADLDPNAGTSDQIATAGAINLANPTQGIFTLNVLNGTTPAASTVFTFIKNNAAGAISNPPLANAAENGSISLNGQTERYTYAGGPGANNFTLTVTGPVSGALIASGSDLVLRKSGTNLQVLNNGNVIDSRPLAGVTSVTLNGLNNVADTATIDFNFGGTFTGGSGGITYNGGTGAGASSSLTIQGGAFGTDTYTYTSAHNGTIQLDSNPLISYTNLTPLSNTGTATNIKFKLPDGTVGASLEDNGNTPTDGSSRLRSTNGTFEQTDFTNPTGSLEIDSGTGPDAVTVAAAGGGIFGFSSGAGAGQFDAGLIIDLANATDTVAVNPALTATSVAITAAGGIALNGGSIVTSGAAGQTYTGAVTLGATTLLDSNNGGAGSNGLIDFTSTVNGAQALTLTSGTGTDTFGGAVGGSTSLVSLADTAATIAISGGKVVTSGAAGQTYTGAVTLGATTLLDSNNGGAGSNGLIDFTSTVNGAQALTLTSGTGTDTFGGAVGGGTSLVSLADTAATIAINGGKVVTSGAAGQTYTGAVTLGATTLLDSNNGGAGSNGLIDFTSTVNGAQALTLTSGTGTDTFGGAVGGGTSLVSLADTAATIAISGGKVVTSGAAGQTYTGAVTLGATTLLNSTNGPIDFTSTVNGAQALTLTSGTGTDTFGGAVGGGTSLVSLADTAATIAINGGKVVTSGAAGQTYTGAVTLGATTLLDSNNGGAGSNGLIDFTSTVNGAQALTLTSGTGTDTFGGAVGGGTSLVSLADTAGTIAINGGKVVTSGAAGQTYTGAVTLGATTLLDSNNGGAGSNGLIDFTSTVNGAQALTLTSGTGTDTFGGAVGGGTLLVSLADTAATIAINGGKVATSGAAGQTYTGAVTLGATTLLNSTNGPIDFTSTVNGAQALTLTSGTGTDTFGGAVGGGTSLVSLADTVATIAINGGKVVTSGAAGQTYTGAVTLGATTLLDSNNGGAGSNGLIDFTSTVNGAQALTLTSGTGTDTFGGAVGGGTSLVSLADTAATIAINGGKVVTSGAAGQTYTGAVTLGATTLLDSNNGGAGSNGLIDFTSTVNGAQALTLTSGTGTDTFGGAVGGGTSLVSLADTAATIAISGGKVVTSGAAGQTYTGAVTLGATTLLNSTNGPIDFTSTVNGAQALTLTSGTGTDTFGGAVGGGTSLVSLADTAATIAINGGKVVTSGAAGQTYTGAVTLGATTLLDSNNGGAGSNGLIDFTSTVNGAQALTLTSGTGTDTFGGAVGGGTSLVSLADTAGTIAINGGKVVTSGAAGQTYTGAVTLGATTLLDSNNGGAGSNGLIDFTSTVNGAQALTLTSGTGTDTFGGAVGGGTPLTSLADTAGTIAINGGSVTTSGGQTYTGNVTLGASTMLTHTGAASLTISGGTLSLSTFTLTDNETTAVTTGSISAQITGTGGIIENGPGTLTLSSVTSTFTGGTMILGGTVIISNDANLGAVPVSPSVNVTINDGTLESTTNSVTLNVNRDISLTGLATINSATAGKTFAILGTIAGPHTLTLLATGGITLSGGVTIIGATGRGVDIKAGAGSVEIDNSTISNNTVTGNGAGIDIESGAGNVTVTSSTISGNKATGNGGGVSVEAGYTNALTIGDSLGATASLGCTIDSNSATNGGGLSDAASGAGTLLVTFSTFGRNTATASGGGLFFSGSGNATLTNDTVSTNTGNGIEVDGGTLNLNFATVAFNSAGGLNNTAGTVKPKDSLFASNGFLTNTATFDYQGSISSQGFNLFQNKPSAALAGTDIVDQAAMLGVLGNNGGPTETDALLPGSAALAAGTPIVGISTEQRGLVARPATHPDIGAFQSQGFTSTTLPNTPAAGSEVRGLIDNDFSIGTTLTAGINNAVASFKVINAGLFAGDLIPFFIRVDSEEMQVTSVNVGTNTLTVIRGANGTPAAAHNAGASVAGSDLAQFQVQVAPNAGPSAPVTGGTVLFNVPTTSFSSAPQPGATGIGGDIFDATQVGTTLTFGLSTSTSGASAALTSFTAGETVVYTGATVIGGLTSGTTYFVIPTSNPGTFELSKTLNGPAISFTSVGGGTQTLVPKSFVNANVAAGTQITLQSPLAFANGQEVIFNSGGGATFGLTNGSPYFVITSNNSPTIQLSATANGPALNLVAGTKTTQFFTAVAGAPANVGPTYKISNAGQANDTINLAPNTPKNFTDGEAVIYENGGGASIAPLVNGNVYFVVLTGLDANTPNAIGLSTTLHGSLIKFTAAGTGTQTLLPATVFSVAAASSTVTVTPPLNFKTGDAVVYENGGMANVTGLNNGQTYYVIKLTSTTIGLATTLAGAVAATPTPMVFTAAGKGTLEPAALATPDFAFIPSATNATGNSIKFANPLNNGAAYFTNGEKVVYDNGGGTSIQGLLEGQTYVVKTTGTPNVITLDQLDGVTPVTFSFVSSGANATTATLNSLEPVLLANGQMPTPTYLLANNVSSAAGTPYTFTAATTSPLSTTSNKVTWNLFNQSVTTLSYSAQPQNLKSGTVNVGIITSINPAANTFTLNTPSFANGQAVTFSSGGGDTFGLIDGNTYYVKRVGSNTIELLNSDGMAATIAAGTVTTQGITFLSPNTLTFGGGQSTSFTSTMTDQDGQPVLLNGAAVSLSALFSGDGLAFSPYSFDAGTTSANTSLGIASFTPSLQVWTSRAPQAYFIRANYTNPDGAAVPQGNGLSNPFHVVPAEIIVVGGNFGGFGQHVFIIDFVVTTRGVVRLISETSGANGLATNTIEVQAFDYAGTPTVPMLSPDYNGPLTLSATDTNHANVVLSYNGLTYSGSPFFFTAGQIIISGITPQTTLGQFFLASETDTGFLPGTFRKVSSDDSLDSGSFVRSSLGRQRGR